MPEDHQIRSRRSKNVVLFNDKEKTSNTSTNTNDIDNSDDSKQISMICYSSQSDFRREIIKGSMHAQRRKTFIWKLFRKCVHSYHFLTD